MISSASHQDKTLNFLDNRIFVKRGELIFPMRKNATFWKISHIQKCVLSLLRLKRRKMITTRLAQNSTNTLTTLDSKSLSIINVM
jgi:hypothetical protein